MALKQLETTGREGQRCRLKDGSRTSKGPLSTQQSVEVPCTRVSSVFLATLCCASRFCS
jgi:hypothetical protein